MRDCLSCILVASWVYICIHWQSFGVSLSPSSLNKNVIWPQLLCLKKKWQELKSPVWVTRLSHLLTMLFLLVVVKFLDLLLYSMENTSAAYWRSQKHDLFAGSLMKPPHGRERSDHLIKLILPENESHLGACSSLSWLKNIQNWCVKGSAWSGLTFFY